MRALPAGSAVVFRDYDHPRRIATAHRYAAICRGRGVLFLVAADDDLAAAIGADGAHWPASRLPERRRPAREGSILSVSAHSARELLVAKGASVIFLSPVFATESHPGAPALGPAAFKRLAAGAPAPVFALGGVDAATAPRLAGPNVCGFGAIGAFVA